MSLTKVNYAMIDGAPLDVMAFGAYNDGTNAAATTAAIKAAITAALAGNGALYFPAGTYAYADTGTFLIDTLTAQKSLTLIGDGSQNTVINLNANNKIFQVNSGENGSGPSYTFNVKGIKFSLVTPATNSAATCFYVCRTSNDWGAHFYVEDCYFNNFSYAAIWGVRCFNSGAKRTTFHGASVYHYGGGTSNPTGFDDAAVRLWGADGSLTVQDHSFSNEARFEQCIFRDVRVAFDGWNIYGSFDECTFTEVCYGLITRPNPSLGAVYGNVSSAEKGGFGVSTVTINTCWFEDIVECGYTNVDINFNNATLPTPSIRGVFNFIPENNATINVGVLTPAIAQTNFTVKGYLLGNKINSSEGQVSCADSTWVPLFQPSPGNVYLLIVRIYNTASAQTSATATVFNNYFDVAMLNKAVGSNIDLQVNYPNIEVKQTMGSTKFVDFSVICMLA